MASTFSFFNHFARITAQSLKEAKPDNGVFGDEQAVLLVDTDNSADNGDHSALVGGISSLLAEEAVITVSPACLIDSAKCLEVPVPTEVTPKPPEQQVCRKILPPEFAPAEACVELDFSKFDSTSDDLLLETADSDSDRLSLQTVCLQVPEKWQYLHEPCSATMTPIRTDRQEWATPSAAQQSFSYAAAVEDNAQTAFKLPRYMSGDPNKLHHPSLLLPGNDVKTLTKMQDSLHGQNMPFWMQVPTAFTQDICIAPDAWGTKPVRLLLPTIADCHPPPDTQTSTAARSNAWSNTVHSMAQGMAFTLWNLVSSNMGAKGWSCIRLVLRLCKLRRQHCQRHYADSMIVR